MKGEGVLVCINHSLRRNATEEVSSVWKKQCFKKWRSVKTGSCSGEETIPFIHLGAGKCRVFVWSERRKHCYTKEQTRERLSERRGLVA